MDPRPLPALRADRRRADRRAGDRRTGQAATLHHRRSTDVRMDAAQTEALLARRTLQAALVPAAPPAPGALPAAAATVVDLVDRVVELPEPEPSVRCPACGVDCDRLWLVRHVVEAHPYWS